MTTLAEERAAEQAHEQLSQDQIWGERAQQLVDHVKGQRPPVLQLASIRVYAQRKGWEKLTIAGVLKYCTDKKLLAGYQSVHGPAFKIPLTPVFDVADDKAPPAKPETTTSSTIPPAPSVGANTIPGAPGCLCARTAPAVNYGCPVHGGTRASKPKKERSTMAKEWISTAEAAELLGVSMNRVCVRIKEKAIEAKEDDSHTGGGRKPFLIKRASVLAFIDARKADGKSGMLDEKPAPTKQPRKKAALVKAEPQTMKRASKPRRDNIVEKLADELGGIREDLIMLVRIVDRGWMSQDQAFTKLREITESL